MKTLFSHPPSASWIHAFPGAVSTGVLTQKVGESTDGGLEIKEFSIGRHHRSGYGTMLEWGASAFLE